MRRLTLSAASAAFAVLLALGSLSAVVAASSPAAAPAPSAIYQEAEEEENDIVPVAVWMTVGILGGALVFGVLYLFKRRVGGFPKDPTWVAPISIMRSETFPKEGDYGDVSPDAHGSHH